MFFCIPTQRAYSIPVIMVLTLWLQNKASSNENSVLVQIHEGLYFVFKHWASPCGLRPIREQPIRAELSGRFPAETSHRAQGAWREK